MNLADIFAAIDRMKRNLGAGWQLPEATISDGGLGYDSRLQAAEANAPIHFDPSGFMGSTAIVGKTLADIAARGAPAIKNAAVRFNGNIYEAATHIQAIKQAMLNGDVAMENGIPKLRGDDSINLFRTNAGDLITRDQALEQYGASRTEDLRAQGDMPDGYVGWEPNPPSSPAVITGKKSMRPLSASTPYPMVYDPSELVGQSAQRVAPENPLMQQLFGVTRHDVDQATLENQAGNLVANIYQAARPPAHVSSVMGSRNVGRLQDIMDLAGQDPRFAGSLGWYWMDPLRQKMISELGPEAGAKQFDVFNQLGAALSPRSSPAPEVARSTLAQSLIGAGRGAEWMTGQMPPGMGGLRQASAVQRLMDTGSFMGPSALVDAPKTAVYYPSRTGANYVLPTPDSHFARAIGLSDVRPLMTDPKTGQLIPNAESLTAPEFSEIGPWFANDVAAPLGLTGSPAQALLWNAAGAGTGVRQVGKPLLEILSDQIQKSATRQGIAPADALQNWILNRGDPWKIYLGQNQVTPDDQGTALA